MPLNLTRTVSLAFLALLLLLSLGTFAVPALGQDAIPAPPGAIETLPTLDEVNISWPPATIEGWIALVFGGLGSLVALATGIALVTPTPKDDEWLKKGASLLVMLKKLIDGLAVGGIFRGLQKKE